MVPYTGDAPIPSHPPRDDFVQFVFEQVEARREAEEAFVRSLDEHTAEIP